MVYLGLQNAVSVFVCLQEECKGWDIDDLVFTNGLWEM